MTNAEPQSPQDDDLAEAIDAACGTGDSEALLRLDQRCAALIGSIGDGGEVSRRARLWYFRSNVQGGLHGALKPPARRWRQPERERQILYLRRARTDPGFARLPRVVQAQISTNLAVQLNALGRSVDSLFQFDQVLRDFPRFAMAQGVRGLTRLDLASMLNEPLRQALICELGVEDLAATTRSEAVWDSTYPDVQAKFAERAEVMAQWLARMGGSAQFRRRAPSAGQTLTERRYRHWAAGEGLFLDPMNIVTTDVDWATDQLHLPDHAAGSLEEPPYFYAWFNQLKQEYATARLLFFEATDRPGPHFADRELGLASTRDMSAFGVDLEKMKLAFRSAYSLLDKIAGFVNAWFKLGMQNDDVTIRNVWHLPKTRNLRPEFDGRRNQALRGLYWLALDIVGGQPIDADAISPAAADLHQLRNALEHRMLVLSDSEDPSPMPWVEVRPVEDFQASTLSMLRLARSALFQLVMAIGVDVQSIPEPEYEAAGTISLAVELGPYRRFRP